MPVFLDRITSRPFGRVYLVAVTRGTADAAAAGRAAACAGAFCAVSVLRPAVERRTARKRASRVFIGCTPADPLRGTRPTPTGPLREARPTLRLWRGGVLPPPRFSLCAHENNT